MGSLQISVTHQMGEHQSLMPATPNLTRPEARAKETAIKHFTPKWHTVEVKHIQLLLIINLSFITFVLYFFYFPCNLLLFENLDLRQCGTWHHSWNVTVCVFKQIWRLCEMPLSRTFTLFVGVCWIVYIIQSNPKLRPDSYFNTSVSKLMAGKQSNTKHLKLWLINFGCE